MKERKKLVAFRIDNSLLERMNNNAERQEMNQSKYIRKAIEEKVEFDENIDIQ